MMRIKIQFELLEDEKEVIFMGVTDCIMRVFCVLISFRFDARNDFKFFFFVSLIALDDDDGPQRRTSN